MAVMMHVVQSVSALKEFLFRGTLKKRPAVTHDVPEAMKYECHGRAPSCKVTTT